MMSRRKKPIGRNAKSYIEYLYMKYAKDLHKIAKSYLTDTQLAADVVQTVFTNALMYPNTLLRVSEDEVMFFLVCMTRNSAFRLTTNEKRHKHGSLYYEDGSEGDYLKDPYDPYAQLIKKHTVSYYMNILPIYIRDTMKMRYMSGLNRKEVAELLNVSERTIKKRCQTGKEMIRRYIKENENLDN